MIKESLVHIHRMKDMPSSHLLGTGTPMCAGCGGLEALQNMYDILGEKTDTENELSRYNFIPKGLASLSNTKRQLHATCFLDI